jgi:hypothetical protein
VLTLIETISQDISAIPVNTVVIGAINQDGIAVLCIVQREANQKVEPTELGAAIANHQLGILTHNSTTSHIEDSLIFLTLVKIFTSSVAEKFISLVLIQVLVPLQARYNGNLL